MNTILIVDDDRAIRFLFLHSTKKLFLAGNSRNTLNLIQLGRMCEDLLHRQ